MIANAVHGKKVVGLHAKPYASGLDGACATIELELEDGQMVSIEASSYAIPEESCLYASVKEKTA